MAVWSMATNKVIGMIFGQPPPLHQCFPKLSSFRGVAYFVISAEDQVDDTSFVSVRSLLPKSIFREYL